MGVQHELPNEHSDSVTKPTYTQILERIEVINAKIVEWTKKPKPTGPLYGGFNPHEPQRKTYEYWNGRSYQTSDVLRTLAEHFGVETSEEVFQEAHRAVYGNVRTERSRRLQEVAWECYLSGNRLPDYVLCAHTECVIKGK